MFEITGDDVRELNDSDLRGLVGLLCEADLRAAGLPVAGVTWGGDQNAPDGGVDVRVELSVQPNPDGFVPRSSTGIQVKKQDMPRSEILNEMRPDGVLRPVIRELAEAEGAYILVSGSGSTSDSALRSRRAAMAEAVQGLENAGSLRLDFYDRSRVAAWVRSHPALAIWTRNKIGRPLQGWQSYLNWANAPGGVQEEYLLDELARLYDGGDPSSKGMSALDGINHLRDTLSQSASSVRLTGLSGVGKTRLLQALFDERLGERALNPTQVFYTDVADSPEPDPRSLAEILIASRTRAILAVDNCPPELHRRLTSVCTAAGSFVSVITVEFDVRDDQPEGTDIFRLEPASVGLVERVIRTRFEHVGQVDAHTIAEFSGGNARIAIALANTVEKGETLSGLKDEDLFQRLFLQRHENNDALLKAAEACSLVYSFEGENTRSADAELFVLGSLVGQDSSELFRNVSELKRRGLVQKRSVWRAVLPHALANRLAQRALENMPCDNIVAVLASEGSERLLKSFSRRLGFLHECIEAVNIVEGWLSEGGLLSDIFHLSETSMAMFENVAPVCPEKTLAVIEAAADGEDGTTFTSRENVNFSKFVSILRSISYDPDLFECCVRVLTKFALSEEPDEKQFSTRDVLKSLFFSRLSGTHASVSQRVSIIRSLATSEEPDKQALGTLLLDASLEATHFTSMYGFEFGARSRDFGFSPRTREEVNGWYSAYIRLAETLAVSNLPVSPSIKSVVANNFRGLWMQGCIFDDLERVARMLANTRNWNEGWLAVRRTLRFCSKNMEVNLTRRLRELERKLAPDDLLQQARAYALSKQWSSLELGEIEGDSDESASDRWLRVERTTHQLGVEVSKHEAVLREILPELVCGEDGRLGAFGQGMAEGTSDPFALWRELRKQLAAIPTDKRNFATVCGFLSGISKRDPALSGQLLDTAITDVVFGERFPLLQVSSGVDNRGVERLVEALSVNLAPIWDYLNLAAGRATENIDGNLLSDLLRAIASKPGGQEVAIRVLQMRFYSDSDKNGAYDEHLVMFGRELLSAVDFESVGGRRNGMDYELGSVASICFTSEEATESARITCGNVIRALSGNKIYLTDYPIFLGSIARVQPLIILDELLNNDESHGLRRIGAYSEIVSRRSHPLAEIPDKVVLGWCDKDPIARYPVVASAIAPLGAPDDDSEPEWTPLALVLLDHAPDVVAVLGEYKRAFRPMSWSGSRADIMEKSLDLISGLAGHANPAVAKWAREEERAFSNEIQVEREWESQRNRERDESFE